MAAVCYGIACVCVLAWAARVLAAKWSAALLFGVFAPLCAYTAGLALAARRMHAGATRRRAYSWLVPGVVTHAVLGATASLVLAVFPDDSHPLNEIALASAMYLVLLGWIPSLALRLLGHAAGPVLLASTLGTVWMMWLLTSIV